MKILFISYNGALEPLIKSQGIPYLEELSKTGVECILLSFEKVSHNKKFFKNATRELKIELRKKNITWYHLRYHKKPTLPATIFDVFTGIFISSYIIIFKKVDIVHARACVAGVIGYIAAKATRRKFLFDERGLMAEEYVDGNMWKKGGFLYNITLAVEKKLLKKSDAVIVLTENIRDFLLTSSYLYRLSYSIKQEITVIPCCVDLNKFNISCVPDQLFLNDNHLKDKFIFLYSGSIGTWYLLKEMIDFFQCAKTLINNAHFLFITQCENSGILKLWKENNLSVTDLTVKKAAYEDMPKLMRVADCGIFFIKPVLSKRSSCPIKFAEYLACGLPIVLNTGIGDTDRITEANGVGVIAKEFSKKEYLSCASNLQKLMEDKITLREKCYSTAHSLFRLELGAEKYLQVYKKLISRKNKKVQKEYI